MKTDIQEKVKKMCEEIENNENYFQVNQQFLHNYVELQDTIPFKLYFQNFFSRMAKNIYNKNYSILRVVKAPDNFNIINQINSIIKNGIKDKDKGDKDTQGNEIKTPLIQQNKKENDKTSSKTTTNLDLYLSDINNAMNKNEITKKLNNYQSKLFQKFEKEIKVENEKQLSYFEDCNNLSGISFESSTIKYIFELVNCISTAKDYDFYTNIKPDIRLIDNIFVSYNLPKINDIQIDFAIYNILFEDFLNVLIYLYNNIYSFDHMNKEIFKNIEKVDLTQLNELVKEINNKNLRLDIIGEIGVNVFNENNKTEQLLKYDTLFKNIKSLEDKLIECEAVLRQLKMKRKNNKKILLFITDGSFINFMTQKENINDKIGFESTQKKISLDSLLVYIKPNINLKENYIINNLVFDYYSQKAQSNNNSNDCIKTIIEAKKKMLFDSIVENKYEKISRGLNRIEKSVKVTDIFKQYLETNKIILFNEFQQQMYDAKDLILPEINVNIEQIDKYQIPENKKIDYSKKDKFFVNVILFDDKTLTISDYSKFKIKELDLDNFHFNILSSENNTMKLSEKKLKYFFKNNKGEYERLKKRIENSVNIIVFVTKFFKNGIGYEYLEIVFEQMNINFLSYLIVFHDAEEQLNNEFCNAIQKYFNKKHIIVNNYSGNVYFHIQEFVNNNTNNIINNYKAFSKEKDKYNYIISTYKNYCGDIFFDSNIEEDNKKVKLEDIFINQVNIMENKIKQDMVYYLTLSLEQKIDEKNFIQISFDGDKNLKDFLKTNKMISGIENEINKYKKTLIVKKKDFNIPPKEIKSNEKYSEELKNNINLIFVSNEVPEVKLKDENEIKDDSKIKNENTSFSNEITDSNAEKNLELYWNNIFNIDTFKENMIKNIISEISFLKLRIYYYTFEKIISGSVKDVFLWYLSKKIIDKENK